MPVATRRGRTGWRECGPARRTPHAKAGYADLAAAGFQKLHGAPDILRGRIAEVQARHQVMRLFSLDRQFAAIEVGHERDVARVGTTAALHGRDLFHEGFTIEQVVRDYGDVCQAVTNLAFETAVPISVDEFRTFNRCLDNAIAGAVAEYAKHTPASNDDNLRASNSRLGALEYGNPSRNSYEIRQRWHWRGNRGCS